jgi:type I restriction enzyme S subunit
VAQNDDTDPAIWIAPSGLTSPTKIGEVDVAFPTSISEQCKIVSKLDALATQTQRFESLSTQKQMALAALKKSLLHQAFSGEL